MTPRDKATSSDARVTWKALIPLPMPLLLRALALPQSPALGEIQNRPARQEWRAAN